MINQSPQKTEHKNKEEKEAFNNKVEWSTSIIPPATGLLENTFRTLQLQIQKSWL